jgi:aldose sugar dehydrogenase
MKIAALGFVFGYCGLLAAAGVEFSSAEHPFRVEPVAEGLNRPWGMAFLPDGDILVTEKGGRLLRIGAGAVTPVSGLPAVAVVGQGGLLDVALHPRFDENGWVYLSHAAAYDNGQGTAVFRGRLEGASLVDGELVFRTADPPQGGVHFGSRLAFDAAGHLFVSVGDRGNRDYAQDLGSHYGKVLRLHDDGAVPADNPFIGQPGARAEVYSYGHRNPQGLFVDPGTGWLWEHEHGPQGGDTLNIIRPGANYGWPVASYGQEYGGGVIGVTPEDREDIENPVTWWGPLSIAPSGLTRLRGAAFPRWEGNLFLGALAQQHIRRLVIDGESVFHQEQLLRDQVGRIRDVAAGPDGMLYFLTDSAAGGLYRLAPVTWEGHTVDSRGWADTGGLLGWVNTRHAPWIYSQALGKWLYAAESASGDAGLWMHIPGGVE